MSVYMRGLSRLLLPMRRPRRGSQPFPPASGPLLAPPRLRGSRIANSITIGASDDFQLGISPAVSAPPLPLLRSSSPLLPHVHSCNPHVDVLYLSCPPPATYSRHNTYHSGNIICEHCSLLCYAPPLPAPVLSFSSSLYPSLRSARSFRPFLTFAPPLVWGGGLASLASHLWSCRSGWVEWFAQPASVSPRAVVSDSAVTGFASGLWPASRPPSATYRTALAPRVASGGAAGSFPTLRISDLPLSLRHFQRYDDASFSRGKIDAFTYDVSLFFFKP
ncbi:hypothetical protein C8J57DRAFT_1545805 [Mycena rebaudengoi]|nr:hypothetical protein C8J57DRAFT_1545805 [Mycena rebaudengoi]